MDKLNNFTKLYKIFVSKYIFKLIGEVIDEDDLTTFEDCNIDDTTFQGVRYDKETRKLYFGIRTKILFCITILNEITSEDCKLIQCIIEKYFKISIYSSSGRKQHEYISEINSNNNYKYAIQSGICNWVVGNNKSEKVEMLFNILENWSSKTYEGKNVSYGIVINLDNDVKGDTKYGSFLDFLNDEFSALISDPITSVFELNDECELISYKTILDVDGDGMVKGYPLINNLPYRFANVITKTVDTSKKIGIFLLNNGDIILAKNKQILFVKRNSNWLNFNVYIVK